MDDTRLPTSDDRRPIKSRNLAVMGRIAAGLARTGISPNAISMCSLLFASLAGAAFVYSPYVNGGGSMLCFLIAAVMIQARLLANLFDGMVAFETGRFSPLGALFNEVPDRVSDAVILIAAGYAAYGDVTLGYVAAVAALFVAYVRVIGASVGAGQAFHGPMAKSQRMFVLTVTALVAALAPEAWLAAAQVWGVGVVGIGLGVIVIGAIVTSARRLTYVCRRLSESAATKSD